MKLGRHSWRHFLPAKYLQPIYRQGVNWVVMRRTGLGDGEVPSGPRKILRFAQNDVIYRACPCWRRWVRSTICRDFYEQLEYGFFIAAFSTPVRGLVSAAGVGERGRGVVVSLLVVEPWTSGLWGGCVWNASATVGDLLSHRSEAPNFHPGIWAGNTAAQFQGARAF